MAILCTPVVNITQEHTYLTGPIFGVHPILFTDLSKKAVVVRFDPEHASSDGGAVLLKAIYQQLGLSARLASCLRDDRQPAKVAHGYEELFAQRMFGIACGYADANDAARLTDDPVHKLLVDRDPIEGTGLASQPALCRFENSVRSSDPLRMGEALAQAVIDRHKRRRKKTKLITIDLDPTEDATHGGQQLTFFNGCYDTWCYLPLAGFLTFDDEAGQYLFGYVLRSGKAPAKLGCKAVLERLLPRLRRAFPKARIRIRLDGGFAASELFEFFEAERLEYVVGISTNSVLKEFAEPHMEAVRGAFEARGERIRQYGECGYRAGKWKCYRRVILKAEITCFPGREPKDNPCFVVTNLKGGPQRIYEQIYCARGDAENRIKELEYGLEIDRTSCTCFLANQFRILMAAAAYVLFQELRLQANGTDCARAQVSTLRLGLLKVGTWIESSVRRIVLRLPIGTAYAADWRRIARSVGVIPT